MKAAHAIANNIKGFADALGSRMETLTTDEAVQLIVQDRVKASSCSCGECQAMCQRIPCMGTPQDILRIVQAGKGGHLAATEWCAGMRYGLPRIPVVQVRGMEDSPSYADGGGQCPLWDPKTGLCTIHDIKPIEGRLGNHAGGFSFWASPLLVAMLSWMLPANRELVIYLFAVVGWEFGTWREIPPLTGEFRPGMFREFIERIERTEGKNAINQG
jgi:Fe-S-cluster containining protein